MFRVGDRVRLKGNYSASEEVKKAFSGVLTITAIQGDVVHLSNGRTAGLTTLTLNSTRYLRKV
jgi:hypothetical protein